MKKGKIRMKKKIIVLLLAGLCAANLLGGCGKGGNGKNSAAQENGGAQTIEYKASDYVTLGEYKGIEITQAKSDVTDAEIRTYVENAIASYPSYENTDKTTVEDGDFVNIDFEGLLDGTAFDGGTSKGHVLEIGSGSFIEGFEAGLIGANVGDSLSLNLTFPENYKEELAGKDVVFNVTVNAIVKKADMTYETLTDAYVSSNFGYDTVQAYLDATRSSLESNKAYYAESEKRSASITKLKEICSVNKLPDGLLDQRVNEYTEDFKTMCKEEYDMEMADYLEKNYQLTEEEFNTQTVDYMKENLELELILQAIANEEKLEVDEEGFENYVKQMMTNYGYESEQAVFDQYGEDYVRTSYLCNKALDLVLENVKITYQDPDTGSADEGGENKDAAGAGENAE